MEGGRGGEAIWRGGRGGEGIWRSGRRGEGIWGLDEGARARGREGARGRDKGERHRNTAPQACHTPAVPLQAKVGATVSTASGLNAGNVAAERRVLMGGQEGRRQG
eukprot:283075-Chlamydomonas_euryale.AAC.1